MGEQADQADHSEESVVGPLEPSKEGLVHVTEGYIRATDVLFEWAKALDPVQANAVHPLVNMTALTHSDHPLHPGQAGLTLHLGTLADGKQRILFSLRQLEYMQYYIHEMRLADPEWQRYLVSLRGVSGESGSGGVRGGEKENISPPKGDKGAGWVPLPNAITRRGAYKSMVDVHFASVPELKKAMNKLHKANKQISKAQEIERMRMKPSPQQQAKMEAEVDNATPGPGLRKGPMRSTSTSRRSRRKEADEEEREPGIGWGGFPITQADGGPEEIAHDGHEGEPAVVQLEGKAPREEEDQSSIAAPEEDAGSLTDKLDEFQRIATDLGIAEPIPQPPSDPSSTTSASYAERYFFHASQAALLASAGGLASALHARPRSPSIDGDDVASTPDAKAGPPKEIGRSLFVALDLTTWEEDENVVLEVGWAGVWWQEKQSGEFQSAGQRTFGPVCKDKDPHDSQGQYEEIIEQGHIIVQDHLLDKRNGKTKSNQRDSYLFGNSLPFPAKDVQATLRRKVKDLSVRAGGGPVYILLHSPDGDESEFRKIGWKTSGWERALQPEGWEYPSYSCEAGAGHVFLIDTAVLFGAIENDNSVLPALGKTRKSLEEVGTIMFGEDPGRAPRNCGNAGNDAFLCLQVFLNVVTGHSLEHLRADYQRSRESGKVDDPANLLGSGGGEDDGLPHGERDVASDPQIRCTDHPLKEACPGGDEDSASPLTPAAEPESVDSIRIIQPAGADDEASDNDGDDQIKGVYYERPDGQIVELRWEAHEEEREE